MTSLSTPAAIALGAGGGLTLSLAHPPLALWAAAPLGAAAFGLACVRAPSASAASVAGLAFGCGAWLPVLGWLYGGIRTDDAPVLAYGLPSVLIASLAGAAALSARMVWSVRARPAVAVLVLLPALWTAFEWLRQFGAFRFPWARLGYTQVDAALAGFAPVFGVLGVGFVTMVVGGLLALAVLAHRGVTRALCATAIVLVVALASLLQRIEWTQASARSVQIAALQGAFPLHDKFDAGAIRTALQVYGDFARESRAQVAIVPESALPLLEQQLPAGYLPHIAEHARAEGRDVLLGFFRAAPALAARSSDAATAHYNSARIVGISGAQNYDKRILLPFGEYVPAARWLRPWFERIASVPMLDTVVGAGADAPLLLGGERVALRLCFEDLFGNFARTEVALASYIVVLANDSWDGSALPMQQHLQVARMRALEAHKPLVRVANTGWSGLIGADGGLRDFAPPDQRAALAFELRPRHGVTPYLRHGDLPVLVVVALALLWPAAQAWVGRKNSCRA